MSIPTRRVVDSSAYLATFIGAMAGLVYSSTLLGQLVFFEITGACSWGLISYYMTPTAKKAGMKALIITHIGALGLYLGRRHRVCSHRHLRHYRDCRPRRQAQGHRPFARAVCGLGQVRTGSHVHVAAFGHGAPTPVSAYLHGASMVKVGVCVFARALVSAGEIPEIVGWVAIIDAMVTMLLWVS